MARLLPRHSRREGAHDESARLSHPLLTQVAHQACRTTSSAAAAITRCALAASGAHELVAAAGDPTLLEQLVVPEPSDFLEGGPVLTRNAAAVLLPLDAR